MDSRRFRTLFSLSLAVLFVFFLFRMYPLVRATSRVDLFYAIFGGLTVATLLSVALSVLLLKNSVFEVNLPRVMVFYAWAGGVLLVTLGRWALQQIRAALQTQGGAQDKVILIGTGEVARLGIQKIHSQPYLGYQLLGLVDGPGASAEAPPQQGRGGEGDPVLGPAE